MKNVRAKEPLVEDRDGFRFRGGSSAIDLTATLQARLKPAPRELLANPSDLDRWLVSARLTKSPPGAIEVDVATARTLREAIFTIAQGLGQAGLDADARDTINQIAARSAPKPVLQADRTMMLEGSAAELLSFLAREAIHLFGSEDGARIRQCQSPSCPIFFLDASRLGDRRWCSMSACGNKAKVAEFRRRKRASARDD